MAVEDVCRYYRENYLDYKLVFRAHRTSCMHYGYYDESTTNHKEAVENTIRLLAEKAGITADDRVLVAGCGLGGGSIWLAENVGAEVVGVDVSPEQLERARENVRSAGVEDEVTLQLDDFTDVSASTDAFDVVWALEAASHADSKRAFVTEASRLLRDGGRLVVGDGMLASEQMTDEEREIVRKWLDGWVVPGLTTPEEFRGHLRDEGFHRIDYEDVTDNVFRTSQLLFLASYVTAPFARVMRACGLRTEDQEENRIAARYQYRAFKRGLGEYGILTAKLG